MTSLNLYYILYCNQPYTSNIYLVGWLMAYHHITFLVSLCIKEKETSPNGQVSLLNMYESIYCNSPYPAVTYYLLVP